jgi:hypothetical protein
MKKERNEVTETGERNQDTNRPTKKNQEAKGGNKEWEERKIKERRTQK